MRERDDVLRRYAEAAQNENFCRRSAAHLLDEACQQFRQGDYVNLEQDNLSYARFRAMAGAVEFAADRWVRSGRGLLEIRIGRKRLVPSTRAALEPEFDRAASFTAILKKQRKDGSLTRDSFYNVCCVLRQTTKLFDDPFLSLNGDKTI